MSAYLLKEQKKNNYFLTLNRPEKHNAFNEELIVELTSTFRELNEHEKVRCIILQGAGPSFCAGADIEWMRKAAKYNLEENYADAMAIAELLKVMNELSKPIVGLAQGSVFGGGIGLLACCDIVLAAPNSQFCFSEAKLGLVPAVIAPYVLRKINFNNTRRYFLTAELFDSEAALNMGLIHKIIEPEFLLQYGTDAADRFSQKGPHALKTIKHLLEKLHPIDLEIISYTSKLLATVRSSPEAQEGIEAFLEKRKPFWSE